MVVSQLTLPPRAEASHLGSATASAGTAPPPAATAIESFQPDLFTGRSTTSIPIAVTPGRKGVQPSTGLPRAILEGGVDRDSIVRDRRRRAVVFR